MGVVPEGRAFDTRGALVMGRRFGYAAEAGALRHGACDRWTRACR